MVDAWETVVVSEPRFDELTQAELRVFEVWESGVCPGCGVHEGDIGNPDLLLRHDVKRCPICADRERYTREHSEKWRKERESRKLPDHAPHPGDGARVILRPWTDEERASLGG